MLTVCCVKLGLKYGPEYVIRLRNMVARHLPQPYRFVCFTENPVPGVECLPLPSDLPSWWSKIGLFRPGLFEGDVLYLDLDVVITASLVPLVSLPDGSGLWVRDDFSYSLRSPKPLDVSSQRYLGGVGTVNSSVMLWRGDACRKVWDSFTPEVMGEVHGDQNYISRTLYPDGIRFIPDEFVGSFKYGQLRGEPIAPVVVFHGDPKMPDLSERHPLRVMWEA